VDRTILAYWITIVKHVTDWPPILIFLTVTDSASNSQDGKRERSVFPVTSSSPTISTYLVPPNFRGRSIHRTSQYLSNLRPTWLKVPMILKPKR